ncbi:MAG TPA: ribulose 1,5-bisphosphate carboxylase large subunit, partial [Spirochaetia bacterium]|nr:ribulose 1,5-bisphosphate carboxylase large subunit [Spirochaetia bacterium]
ESGISHAVLYGQLMRLAGADATIFPNYGGRFSFSREQCAGIAALCAEEMGGLRPILPAPGGGMTADRAGDMREVYGRDFILLIGAGLHRLGGDLRRNAAQFVELVGRM